MALSGGRLCTSSRVVSGLASFLCLKYLFFVQEKKERKQLLFGGTSPAICDKTREAGFITCLFCRDGKIAGRRIVQQHNNSSVRLHLRASRSSPLHVSGLCFICCLYCEDDRQAPKDLSSIGHLHRLGSVQCLPCS